MAKKQSKLERVAHKNLQMAPEGVTKLLIRDHKAMRELMKKIKSKKSTPAQVISTFNKLEKLVDSHVKAEETALLSKTIDHPIFKDEAEESLEEHRVHDYVFAGIRRLRATDRKVEQMKIYCEMLEHHLKEEEEDLFPKFRKYTALSTRKKIGAQFLRRRKATSAKDENSGALKVELK